MRASHRPSRLVRTVAAFAVSLSVGMGVVACTAKPEHSAEQLSETDALLQPLVEGGSTVVADDDGTGIDASKAFFETANDVVISASSHDAQLKAAAIAVDLGAPMLIRHPGTEETVEREVSRLGAQRRIQVSSEDPADTSIETEQDAEDIALIDETPPLAPDSGSGVAQVIERGASSAKPAKTPVLATEATSLAAVATATAQRIPVTVLSHPDPRVTRESMDQVKGKQAVALGHQFGSSEYFRGAVDMAANGELPGGGGLVFPGRMYGCALRSPVGSRFGADGGAAMRLRQCRSPRTGWSNTASTPMSSSSQHLRSLRRWHPVGPGMMALLLMRRIPLSLCRTSMRSPKRVGTP